MNLFVLDNDHAKNAEYHVDKHCGKMLLEATQLMCTQFHLQGIVAPYKPTHKNHPCSVFCRASINNFLWVFDYATALHKEFMFRRGKSHKTGREVLPWILNNIDKLVFPTSELTDFALAMPEQYRTKDPVKSYRDYYKNEKVHLFKWTQREKPQWLTTS